MSFDPLPDSIVGKGSWFGVYNVMVYNVNLPMISVIRPVWQ